MMYFHRFLIFLIPFLHAFVNAKAEKEQLNTFLYPGKANSERDLEFCKKNEVCSIVHKRFWYPVQVERLCRCEANEKCPSTWSSVVDNYTMNINNRAQMKFCESIAALPICGDNSSFLNVENLTSSQDVEFSAIADCYCPPHRKWVENKRLGNSSLNYHAYRCSKLSKCRENELCGLERVDNYEIYYQCSCPVGDLCTRRDDLDQPADQLFYTGPAFKVFCTKYPDIVLNITKN